MTCSYRQKCRGTHPASSAAAMDLSMGSTAELFCNAWLTLTLAPMMYPTAVVQLIEFSH